VSPKEGDKDGAGHGSWTDEEDRPKAEEVVGSTRVVAFHADGYQDDER
jgi:hypothetical protein